MREAVPNLLVRAVRWLPDLFLGVLLLLLAWGAVESLSFPFGRDQGILAWSADVISSGGLPYRDAWDVKGPAAPGAYALAFLFFGRHEVAIRILDTVVLGFCGLIFLSLSKRWNGGRRAGAFALCFFYFWTPRNFWDTGQPDTWAAVLLLAAAWCVTRREWRTANWLVAGLLVGTASLIKPLFLVLAIGLAVSAVVPRRRAILVDLFWLAAGLGIPIIAVILVFAARHVLPSLIEVQVHFNLATHAARHSTSVAWFLHHGLEPFFGLRGLAMAALIVMGIFALRAVDPMSLGPIAFNGLLSYALVFWQAKFYPYHFAPVMALFAPLAGLGAERLIGLALDRRTAASSTIATAMVGVLLIVASTQAVDAMHAGSSWLSYERGHIDRATYIDELDRPYSFPYRDLVDAANYVRTHTASTDRIYMLGFDALVYFEADRKSVTRFGYSYPLISGPWQDIGAARHELMGSLANGAAALILVEKNDANNLTGQSGTDALQLFPELQRLLEASYEVSYDNPAVTIYGRRSAGD